MLPLSQDLKGAPVVKKFYQDHKLAAFPVLIDTGGVILRQAGVRGLPTTLFIDAGGREIGRVTGVLEWDAREVADLVRACLAPGRAVTG